MLSNFSSFLNLQVLSETYSIELLLGHILLQWTSRFVLQLIHDEKSGSDIKVSIIYYFSHCFTFSMFKLFWCFLFASFDSILLIPCHKLSAFWSTRHSTALAQECVLFYFTDLFLWNDFVIMFLVIHLSKNIN